MTRIASYWNHENLNAYKQAVTLLLTIRAYHNGVLWAGITNVC